jgi:hypothetical protein
MLPSKITLISRICSSPSVDSPDDVRLDGHLLCVVRVMEMPLLFLIGGLLAMIPVISAVLAVSSIGHVDLLIALLLF